MQKAYSLGADVIILDLEDAVPLTEKARARELVARFFSETGRAESTMVRVNGVGTGLTFADLRAVLPAGVRHVVLPKVNRPDELREVESYLLQLESELDLAPGRVSLLPFVESAEGVMSALAIAGASPRVRRLAFGGVDYTLDIGVDMTQEGDEILYARSVLVVSSRAAGLLPPIDTVYPNFEDLEGLESHSRQARRLGFGGKLVIHPAQIEPVNRVFSPTEAELKRARRIVHAFEEALASGTGVARLDGSMVEAPIAERARRLLDWVEERQ